MLRKGWVAALAAAVLGPIAQASSYELLMVLDYGTRSVHRFDGATGRYLGEFGRGFLAQPESLTIDASRGLAYVGDERSRRIRVFDYSTGVHLRDILAPDIGFRQTLFRTPQGNLGIGYLAGGLSLSSDTGSSLPGRSITTVNGRTAIANAGANHRSGRTLLLTTTESTEGFWAIQTADLSTLNAFTLGSGVSTGITSFHRSQIGVGGDRAALVTEGAATIRYFTVLPSGNSLTMTSNISLAGTFTTVRGVAFGHGETVYVAGRNAANSSGVIMRTMWGDNFDYATFGAGILQQPGEIHSVVAPEPGTLAAAGFGLAALAARRRRRTR